MGARGNAAVVHKLTEFVDIKERQKSLARLRSISQHWKLRTAVQDTYGGRCVCCGETISEFLTIEHIEGGGTKHRESVGGPQAFYRWLKKQKYPKDKFELLCMNCNFAKRGGNVCPHKVEPIVGARKAKLLALHKSMTEQARKLMEKKNADYTGESDDPFYNFRRHGLYGILVRLNDKLARLESFVQRGDLKVKDESVQDTLRDLLNYAVLFAAYIEDTKGE